MRVKIGNVWYDSNETPICVQCNGTEKLKISTSNRRQSFFPDRWGTENEMLNWPSSGPVKRVDLSDVDVLETIARKSCAISAMVAVGQGRGEEAKNLAKEIASLAAVYADRCAK